MRLLKAIGIGLFFWLVVGCGTSPEQTANNRPEEFLAKFQFQDLAGNAKQLADYQGKAVVFHFWATWCQPCLSEFPDLKEVTKQFGDRIQFVLVSDEPLDVLRPFAEQHELDVEFVQLSRPLEELSVHSLPTNYFILPSGKLKSIEVGQLEWMDEASHAFLTNLADGN